MGFLEDMARAFDPNQNGVAKAFDPHQNGLDRQINSTTVMKVFDPNQNGVNAAFHRWDKVGLVVQAILSN
jgi:hypothetical protein